MNVLFFKIYPEEKLPLLAPSSFQEFMENSNAPQFEGVSDCHEKVEDKEIGMSSICESGPSALTRYGYTCICEAIFRFQKCSSCTLCEGAMKDGLTIKSFSADCSGIDDEYPTCRIGCGFETTGCFPDVDKTQSDSSTANVKRFALYNFLAAVGIIVLVS
mmetsp:Transcript_18898/g.21655  ORF Transcript_18898/g.21655 Transcript_18898/m.21655 type:complete len:160 (-) Transcript_18898:107-586(-)